MDIFGIFTDSNLTVTNLLIVSLVCYVIYLLVNALIYIRTLNHYFGDVPGPKRHWLYGNLHLLPEKGEERIALGSKLNSTYPRYWCFWLTNFNPTLMVLHPDTMKDVMKTSGEERVQYALENSMKYPRHYCFWAGGLNPMLVVTHPETVRAVMKTAALSMKRCIMLNTLTLLPKTDSHDRIMFGNELCNTYKRFYVWWNTFLKTSITVCHPETVRIAMKTSALALKCLYIQPDSIMLPKTNSHDRILFGTQLCNSYKRFFVWWNTPLTPFVTVCHPETVRIAMKTSEPKPTGFGGMYRFGLPWLGEGLLIAGGQKWARSRRLLTPAFHFDILKPYIAVYNDAADQLCNNLMRYAEKNEKFEVFEYISKSTLDVILRCAFSYVTDCQKESGVKHPYVKAVEEIADMWNYRARKPWLYPDFIFYITKHGRQFSKNCDYVHHIAEDIIQKRKDALEKNGQTDRKYLDFLDILLTARDETGQGLTPLEIRNEVDTFLFEGHDTTASAISWILYSLAKHPEYQQKCQEEIDNILQDRSSDDIEWSDLSHLEYLTMCIKEGMRHHSPVPFIQREFTHDFVIDGRTFPAGTSVSLHIFGLHHNETVWDKPMEYIPERFSKENVAKMDSFQFVPFSAGPRNCIGQNFAMNEEKVVLSKLLRRFTFKLDPDHNVRRKVGAVMRAENGIYMYATPRAN